MNVAILILVIICRVVIMSATVDADKFSQYWNCPVLYIEGRQFPVNIRLVFEF